MNLIRITLRSFDHKLLDQSIHELVSIAKRTGSTLKGPVLLPTKKTKFTVLSSPHIDKKARDQFEYSSHKRLVDILNPTDRTLDEFVKLNLASGINIKITVKD